jgi:hypothetical protein
LEVVIPGPFPLEFRGRDDEVIYLIPVLRLQVVGVDLKHQPSEHLSGIDLLVIPDQTNRGTMSRLASEEYAALNFHGELYVRPSEVQPPPANGMELMLPLGNVDAHFGEQVQELVGQRLRHG